jgi:hypothetical protein
MMFLMGVALRVPVLVLLPQVDAHGGTRILAETWQGPLGHGSLVSDVLVLFWDGSHFLVVCHHERNVRLRPLPALEEASHITRYEVVPPSSGVPALCTRAAWPAPKVVWLAVPAAGFNVPLGTLRPVTPSGPGWFPTG